MSIKDLGFNDFIDDLVLDSSSLVVGLGAWKGEFSE